MELHDYIVLVVTIFNNKRRRSNRYRHDIAMTSPSCFQTNAPDFNSSPRPVVGQTNPVESLQEPCIRPSEKRDDLGWRERDLSSFGPLLKSGAGRQSGFQINTM